MVSGLAHGYYMVCVGEVVVGIRGGDGSCVYTREGHDGYDGCIAALHRIYRESMAWGMISIAWDMAWLVDGMARSKGAVYILRLDVLEGSYLGLFGV